MRMPNRSTSTPTVLDVPTSWAVTSAAVTKAGVGRISVRTMAKVTNGVTRKSKEPQVDSRLGLPVFQIGTVAGP